MFETIAALVDEHAELERRLSLPETHADARLAKKLNQRYAELTAIVTTWHEWQQTEGDIAAARELGADDPDSPPRPAASRPSARSSRSGCAACSCRATRPTTRTPSSR